MSQGNYKSAYCEELQGLIHDVFHEWRKENNLDADVMIDGIILNKIVANAKLRLYAKRPEAMYCGYVDEDDPTLKNAREGCQNRIF